MAGPTLIESFAIISEDGMLADANLQIPDELKVEADQKFFHEGLARSAVVVQGRNSYEGGPDAPGRQRLIATRRIPALAPDPTHPRSYLWNPRGASLAQAWEALGSPHGSLAVIGGPDVYALFLEIGYDIFHLTRVPDVRLPGGRPVFPQIGPDRTPEEILTHHGLKPGPEQIMDAARQVTLVTWQR